MSLIDQHKADGLQGKTLKQIVGFAGDGALRDGNETSREFREWLGRIQLPDLRKYAEECLESKFDESGRALQDIVNQVGRRLGFQMEDGRYRGAANASGHDGVWKLPNGRAIVVEVKTTDVYRISLDILAGYRRRVIESGGLREEHVSVLLVVGRQDASGLEEQIRGSSHVGNMRVISVDALLKIAEVKENVEEPTFQRIHDVLIPRDFIRLDGIAELVLSVAKDSTDEGASGEMTEAPSVSALAETVARREDPGARARVSFKTECLNRVERELKERGAIAADLIRRSQTTFHTPDKKCGVVCAVSKNYGDNARMFWFGLSVNQQEFLGSHEQSWLALGGDSEGGGTVFLFPWDEFSSSILPHLRFTRDHDTGLPRWWQVDIRENDGNLELLTTGEQANISLSDRVLRTDDEA